MAPHRPVAHTLAYPRHTRCHPGRSQLAAEHPGGVLEAPAAVGQGMGVRVGGKGQAQRPMGQGAAVGIRGAKGAARLPQRPRMAPGWGLCTAAPISYLNPVTPVSRFPLGLSV